MPKSQRDMLMCRKDALFNPDRQKPKNAPQMNARELRRSAERKAKGKGNEKAKGV